MAYKQEIKDQLILMTKEFCSEHVNDEYTDLCGKLIAKMARKRNVPFMTGRIEIWAAAVIYTIGSINFLFDKKAKPYASTDLIIDYFGVSKSTVSQKSKVIKDMFKIRHWDQEFSTQRMLQNNPYANLRMLNGYVAAILR